MDVLGELDLMEGIEDELPRFDDILPDIGKEFKRIRVLKEQSVTGNMDIFR